MSDFAKYSFSDHRSGDTFNGKTFTFSSHPSGTLKSVQFKTVRGDVLKSGAGITILNAADWIFKIDAQVIKWQPGALSYGITTTSSEGISKTFIRGTWQVL